MLILNINSEPERAAFLLGLQAIVAWPQDADARRAFVCSQAAVFAEGEAHLLRQESDPESKTRAEAWLAAWEQVYEREGGRRTLIRSPSYDEMIRAHTKQLARAYLAGMVLSFTVRLAEQHGDLPGGASIRKAKAAILGIDERHARAWELPRSQRPIDEAWASHQCVAHIAAAMSTIDAEALLAEEKPGHRPRAPHDVKSLTRLLRLARTYQERALRIAPHGRQGEPIVTLQGLIAVSDAFPPLTDGEFAPLPDELLTALRAGK
jgi:hypothetical protein